MSARSTLDKLTDIFIEQLAVEPGDIQLDARFVEDLGADSLNLAEIILAIEREWNLEIDEATAERATTVGEAIALIDDLCQ